MVYLWCIRREGLLIDRAGKSTKGWWWSHEVLGGFSVSDDIPLKNPAGNMLLAKVFLGTLAIRRGLKIMWQ